MRLLPGLSLPRRRRRRRRRPTRCRCLCPMTRNNAQNAPPVKHGRSGRTSTGAFTDDADVDVTAADPPTTSLSCARFVHSLTLFCQIRSHACVELNNDQLINPSMASNTDSLVQSCNQLPALPKLLPKTSCLRVRHFMYIFSRRFPIIHLSPFLGQPSLWTSVSRGADLRHAITCGMKSTGKKPEKKFASKKNSPSKAVCG